MEKQGNHAELPYNAWLAGECERTARAAGVAVIWVVREHDASGAPRCAPDAAQEL
jgi:hypothetical protein